MLWLGEGDPYYDYSKYKLFLLSLLWRASISSRSLFNQIKLPVSIEGGSKIEITK
jgi:hypothetical protein